MPILCQAKEQLQRFAEAVEPPLHALCRAGDVKAVQAVLDACKPDRRLRQLLEEPGFRADGHGYNALHWAAWSGHAEVVTLLLPYGAGAASPLWAKNAEDLARQCHPNNLALLLRFAAADIDKVQSCSPSVRAVTIECHLDRLTG